MDISPQILTTEQAATFVGCVTADGKANIRKFLREVQAGVWPKARVMASKPYRWSLPELIRAVGPAGTSQQFIDPKRAELDRRLGRSR